MVHDLTKIREGKVTTDYWAEREKIEFVEIYIEFETVRDALTLGIYSHETSSDGVGLSSPSRTKKSKEGLRAIISG